MLSILILCLIVLTIIVVGYLLKKYNFVESFGENQKNTPRELSKFINFNLTENPVANYAPYAIYKLWENGQLNQTYRDCDQYRCQNKQFNQCNAEPAFNLNQNTYRNPCDNQLKVKDKNARKNCAYYADTSAYCANHPEDPRCPDYWRHQNK